MSRSSPPNTTPSQGFNLSLLYIYKLYTSWFAPLSLASTPYRNSFLDGDTQLFVRRSLSSHVIPLARPFTSPRTCALIVLNPKSDAKSTSYSRGATERARTSSPVNDVAIRTAFCVTIRPNHRSFYSPFYATFTAYM